MASLPCSILDRLHVVSGGKVRGKDGARGNGELPMNDAQRYRMNAAECLSAAERCDPAYRGLTLAIAASWLSLARQQEAVDGVLAIWSKAQSAAPIRPAAFRRFAEPPVRWGMA
jgi:hypothetical protein